MTIPAFQLTKQTNKHVSVQTSKQEGSTSVEMEEGIVSWLDLPVYQEGLGSNED